jgi:hypothetical protein
MPDRIQGTPDEILDRVVLMFLEWTAAPGEERQPAAAGPVQERRPTPLPTTPQSRPSSRLVPEQSQPTARVPQPRPTIREAMQERRATAAGSTQARRPAAPRTMPERRPAPVEVPVEKQPAPEVADTASEAEAAPQGPGPIRETPAPNLRTYQLLFETTRRQLRLAEVVPASSRYSLIGAGVFVAFTAEAFFNDLGSRVIPSWSQLQRLDPREKAEVLSIELFNVRVDWSIRPFRSVAEALGFSRALAHAHAETLSFDPVRTDRKESEVPRTRRTAWQEHCDVATIQRWVTDVRLLIEHFTRAHDPTEVAIGMVERPSGSASDDAITRKGLRLGDSR